MWSRSDLPVPLCTATPAALDPENLGPGWVDFDYRKAFRKPVKLINDAAMQALGSYTTGRMLFLGLGTGLGSTLILDEVVIPLELGQLRYTENQTLEDALGEKVTQENWPEKMGGSCPRHGGKFEESLCGRLRGARWRQRRGTEEASQRGAPRIEPFRVPRRRPSLAEDSGHGRTPQSTRLLLPDPGQGGLRAWRDLGQIGGQDAIDQFGDAESALTFHHEVRVLFQHRQGIADGRANPTEQRERKA